MKNYFPIYANKLELVHNSDSVHQQLTVKLCYTSIIFIICVCFRTNIFWFHLAFGVLTRQRSYTVSFKPVHK